MPLKQINASDRVVQTIQTNVARSITDIEAGPFVDGNRLANIALTSGQDNLIAHGLSRQLLNWVLVGQNTNATVWSPSTATLGNANANSQYLNLRCSASCTASFWVS